MMGNRTSVIEFILLGLTDDADLQALLFLFLLLTNVLSILGNVTIISLTLLDYRLQTPMYFFLRNFSFLEICFTSVFVPKMLLNIGTGDKTISFAGCFTQYFFAILLGATEFYLLAAMSYDRYAAICKPLHYTTLMSKRLCIQLVLCSWFSGFLVVVVPHTMALQLPFCASNVINHDCCDYTVLLHLSCRHMFHRNDGAHLCGNHPQLHLGASDSFLHVHHQDNSENPLCSTKKKSFFYMLLSHDCGLTFLWKLYLYVHKSFC